MKSDGKYKQADGSTVWYKDGKIHREDGPAVIWPDGSEYWYRNGKRHREDGPASMVIGLNVWYKDGKIHRTDGPAMEDPANKFHTWYVDNIKVKNYKHYQELTQCSDGYLMYLKFKYGEIQ